MQGGNTRDSSEYVRAIGYTARCGRVGINLRASQKNHYEFLHVFHIPYLQMQT